MTKVFLENYSANINKGITPSELYTIIQQPDESLRNYIKRFSKAVTENPNCDDTIALFALKKGLLPESAFLNKVYNHKAKMIGEALVSARGLIEAEEVHANKLE